MTSWHGLYISIVFCFLLRRRLNFITQLDIIMRGANRTLRRITTRSRYRAAVAVHHFRHLLSTTTSASAVPVAQDTADYCRYLYCLAEMHEIRLTSTDSSLQSALGLKLVDPSSNSAVPTAVGTSNQLLASAESVQSITLHTRSLIITWLHDEGLQVSVVELARDLFFLAPHQDAQVLQRLVKHLVDHDLRRSLLTTLHWTMTRQTGFHRSLRYSDVAEACCEKLVEMLDESTQRAVQLLYLSGQHGVQWSLYEVAATRSPQLFLENVSTVSSAAAVVASTAASKSHNGNNSHDEMKDQMKSTLQRYHILLQARLVLSSNRSLVSTNTTGSSVGISTPVGGVHNVYSEDLLEDVLTAVHAQTFFLRHLQHQRRQLSKDNNSSSQQQEQQLKRGEMAKRLLVCAQNLFVSSHLDSNQSHHSNSQSALVLCREILRCLLSLVAVDQEDCDNDGSVDGNASRNSWLISMLQAHAQSSVAPTGAVHLPWMQVLLALIVAAAAEDNGQVQVEAVTLRAMTEVTQQIQQHPQVCRFEFPSLFFHLNILGVVSFSLFSSLSCRTMLLVHFSASGSLRWFVP